MEPTQVTIATPASHRDECLSRHELTTSRLSTLFCCPTNHHQNSGSSPAFDQILPVGQSTAVASQNIELVSLEAGRSSSPTRNIHTPRPFTARVTPNTSPTTHRRTTTGINSGLVPHDDTASTHSGSQDHEGTGLLQLHSEGANRARQPQNLNYKSYIGRRPHILWAEALDKRHRGREKSPIRYEPANMKFSHSLQFNSVPDWSAHYIAYDNLKKLYV